MPRKIEPIVTSYVGAPGEDETKQTHPAFGQIMLHKVSGQRALYGSDFMHQHYVTISISKSQLNRSLSRDWAYAREEIIEVALSEAQFAAFVSSQGVGAGTQCTIAHLNGQMVPEFELPETKHAKFEKEFIEKAKSSIAAVRKSIDAIENSKIPKSQKETFLGSLRAAQRELESNMPYVAEQFGEHMEEVTEAAKSEIHGYMMSTLARAGLETLQAQLPIDVQPQLEGPDAGT